MRQLLLIGIAFASYAMCYAQVPTIDWEKNYGGSEWDIPFTILPTNGGGYIVSGLSESSDQDVSNNYGGFDYWVVQLTASHTIEWEKNYGGTGNEVAYAMQPTTDGGYILAGYSQSSDHDVSGNYGYGDYWLLKLSASGSIEWEKNYGGSEWDRAYAVRQTTDGGYIVAGQSKSSDHDVSNNYGDSDYWILKLNADGSISWQNNYGGSGIDYAQDIQQTSDGGFIVAGYSESSDGDVSNNHGNYDYWIVKLDAAGNIMWENNFGGSGQDEARSILQTSDGGYIVAGASNSNDHDITNNKGNFDYWLVKLNASGDLQWQKNFGGSDYEVAECVQQDADGGFIVAGVTASTDHDVSDNNGHTDYWVVKTNSAGNLLWESNYGGSGWDLAHWILPTSDEGYIMAGYSDSDDQDVSGNKGTNDFWVVKLNAPVGLAAGSWESTFNLHPNPTTGTVSIDLGIHHTWTQTNIYTVDGKVVSQHKFYNVRYLDLNINGVNGMYVISIMTPDGSIVFNKVLKQGTKF